MRDLKPLLSKAIVFLLLACAMLGKVNALETPSAAQQKHNTNRAPAPTLGSALLHVRMQAVILSDDDGSNPSGILDTKQLKHWVFKANQSYRASSAHLHLDFDPATDLTHVKNSCLNRLNHNQNGTASALAAQYPGKLVVFFRAYNPTGSALCGPASPTGNGYSAYNNYVPFGSPKCQRSDLRGCSASYVVMPSVYCLTGVGTDFANSKDPGPSVPTKGKDTSGCPIFIQPKTDLIFVQNYSQLTHEISHYFGLPHTMPGPNDALATPGAIQSWYDGPPRSGTVRSIRVFDGDSPNGPLDNGGYTGWTFTVTDTPPDVGAQIYVANGINMCNTPNGKTISDSSGASVTFNGASYTFHGRDQKDRPLTLKFTPQKDNVMSYFLCGNPMKFSASQVATIRNNLEKDPERQYLLCDEAANAPLRSQLKCPQLRPRR